MGYIIMKTRKDLKEMFHQETGMYYDNHLEEYRKWVEEKLIEQLDKDE